jgi:hypothetical protein
MNKVETKTRKIRFYQKHPSNDYYLQPTEDFMAIENSEEYLKEKIANFYEYDRKIIPKVIGIESSLKFGLKEYTLFVKLEAKGQESKVGESTRFIPLNECASFIEYKFLEEVVND